MRKKETESTNKTINYESEAAGIQLRIKNVLLDHDSFYYHSLIENINLMEMAMIDYSILKLVEWDCGSKILDYNQIGNFGYINKVISVCIPSIEENKAYFMQYINTIITTLAYITRQQTEISIIESDEIESIELLEEDNCITTILMNPDSDTSTLPSLLLNKLKKRFKEKTPTISLAL